MNRVRKGKKKKKTTTTTETRLVLKNVFRDKFIGFFYS